MSIHNVCFRGKNIQYVLVEKIVLPGAEAY